MPEATIRRNFTGNLFLDHLAEGAKNALKPPFVSVPLKQSEVIDDDETVPGRILFPVNSIISIVLDMANGDTAEVGIIGREGMTGLAIVLGQPSVNRRRIVQIPGSAISIPTRDFRAAIDREPALRSYALRYAQATLVASGRLSACNVLHAATERCARWLLMAQDRVGDNLLLLTQEVLGQMLGVRRESVALAASELRAAGYISYSRGHIRIHNRTGLESASCECYDAMNYEWKATMGYKLRVAQPAVQALTISTLRSGGVAQAKASK